jgi:hypothetical protein
MLLERTKMTPKNQYSEANAASLKELTSFTAALTDSQLTTSMPANWTVSAVFVHLAFWDFRNITLIKKWLVEGVSASINDVDVVNEATRPFFIAVEPRQAVRLSLAYAHELDELIDSLEPAFIQSIEDKGKSVWLDRSRHRNMHMSDIKNALGLK